MAFYIKKSIRVGILRFNLSKSGLGVSTGIKGLKVGFGPRGNYIHAGMNGIYYRSTLSPKQVKGQLNSNKPDGGQLPQNNSLEMKEIDSDMQLLFNNSTADELTQELNEKFKMVSVWYFLPIVSLILAAYTHPLIFGVGLILAIPAYFWDSNRKAVVLFYDFEERKLEEYKNLISEFENATSVRQLWHIESEGKITDWKKNAGAGVQVRRKSTKYSQQPPSFIRSNIPIPTLNVGKQILCFLPEKALLFSNSAVASISYDDLEIEIESTKFIESQSVPSDSEIVDHTWQYVNKSGGPDKRFKDNRKFPVCKYETIDFSSSTGLNERLMVSKCGQANGLKRILKSIKAAA